MKRALAMLPLLLALAGAATAAGERTAKFDRDPGWDGRNNRSTAFAPREIVQDFGYSRTGHAGGRPGEIGGKITPAGEQAYYALPITPRTFNDSMEASGRMTLTSGSGHLLIGFFDEAGADVWRTPNSIALRIHGRGDHFYAYVEYATSKWRAGGDSPGGFTTVADGDEGKRRLRGFAGKGAIHTWSIRYDPAANQGGGAVTVTVDDETSVCNLSPGHKADGARFNRFGILPVMKQWDDPGEVWLDDLRVQGRSYDFDRDPLWDERGNRRTYTSENVRPRFNFGYSPTRFAGGAGAGEIGGLVFRGDNRYPERMACYGDRLETLDLNRPLRAAGRIGLRRGVSDSTTLLGFYHSRDSMEVSPSQANGLPASFLGIAVEGPSSEGFLFDAACRLGGHYAWGRGTGTKLHILPDGASHVWSLAYNPQAGEGKGSLSISLDDRSLTLILPEGARASGAQFDRFGFVTAWIDGNGQTIYFDDLTYTAAQ